MDTDAKDATNGCKLRSRRPQTLKELRKTLMEMKIVSLILCCRLGEAVCQGKRIKPDEKCSGMIRMGISLLRCWNSNQDIVQYTNYQGTFAGSIRQFLQVDFDAFYTNWLCFNLLCQGWTKGPETKARQSPMSCI
ncbi:unnamed protein product [Prunus armeniaca]|uniref:Uncharacterized protein n=1 Tax=Prunus armeniaca TaxID=36596 RepID=A0A6J5VY65_PRUAR|nr:unnamed protein product [Prunus armeniaca]